ncbi:MAG: SdrD B-like domain-containing protein [Bryobacteraceae bacterium]
MNSNKSRVTVLVTVMLGVAAAHAAKDSFKISGYIGRSSTEAASGVTVKLLDGETGKVLDSVRTGFTGRYKFENLKPGQYIVQANELKVEAFLKAKDLRLDIDLSAKDGTMRYLKTEDIQRLASAAAGAAGGSTAPPAGPSDPGLMAQFAGSYWGFSGSTERSLTLCPGGTFSEQSESSYSGTSRDSLGNQTMAWGTASQGGSQGNWSIQGDARQGRIRLSYNGGRQSEVSYRQVDQGCFSFNGNTMCRKGAAACR